MTAPETVVLVLPLPPAVLSPNRPCGSAGGRMKRAAAAKKLRRLAREAVEAENIESSPWPFVTARATFYHKSDRRRDGANFNATLKAAIDGVVDAGLMPDDDHTHFTLLPPKFRRDSVSPRVEIEFSAEAYRPPPL